jgi:hypothetical protein
MTDHDDKLSRRYRELSRDEPPSAVDAAILSAASRALRSRPPRNWAVPMSIAAVLVLGIGVSLRMQLEQPGIETSAPASEQYVPHATPPAPADLATQPSAPQAAPATVAPPAVQPAKRKIASEPKAIAQDKAVSAPALRAPAAAASPEPRPFADSIAPASPPPALGAPAQNIVPAAPQSGGAVAPASVPMAPARARSEAGASGTAQTRALMKSAIGVQAAELDRIARLRSEGRHAEADKALEEFRRRYPDYRIPEDVLERVKPR